MKKIIILSLAMVSGVTLAYQVPATAITTTPLNQVDITQYCIYNNVIYAKGAQIKQSNGTQAQCTEEPGNYRRIDGRRVVMWVELN